MLVLTLIANPQKRDLATGDISAICTALKASNIEWLSKGCACDIALPSHMNTEEAKGIINLLTRNKAIDFAIQEQDGRRKKALIADMDSTMIEQECIDELAAEVGLKDKVSAITARAMNGEIEFESAVEERVALLKGLSSDIAEKVISDRVTYASGSKTLVKTMQANGAHTALVSGGFVSFTKPISEYLGFHENRANILEAENGALTGRVRKPILGAEAKVEALEDIANSKSITPLEFIAVGDGANDLPMLQHAGTGVALHAKPTVAEQAQIRIDNGDLTSLLYLQGYKETEFIHE
ncbi:MAG: phosphoserine phosphatase SerB [Pseudomonadota bacterium]